MKPGMLRVTLLDALALAWLEEPGQGLVLAVFAEAHGVRAYEMEHVVADLRRESLVWFHRVGEAGEESAVGLTQPGQRAWLYSRLEIRRPELRQQVRHSYLYLSVAGATTPSAVRAVVPMPDVTWRQVMQVMRSLGVVVTLVDAGGEVSEIRVHTHPGWNALRVVD